MKYECKKCNKIIDSDKPRKRCGSCRNSLSEIKEEESYIFRPLDNRQQSSQSFSQTGDKKLCKTVPIKIKTQFLDYTDEHLDDKIIDKKNLKSKGITARYRPKAELVTMQCNSCGRTEKIPAELVNKNYKCEKCIRNLRI